MARAAVKSSDENLAAVLRALDQKSLRDKTDVFVVSDHGFSTVEKSFDVAGLWNEIKTGLGYIKDIIAVVGAL